jgi:adenylate cyclase
MEHRHDDLSLEELRAFHRVAIEADEVLEVCLRDRLSLRATLDRFLPHFGPWMGARGVLLRTADEHLNLETFTWGEAEVLRESAPRTGDGLLKLPSGDTLLWRKLDLAGVEVGKIELLLSGDQTRRSGLVQLELEAACEELDAVLATVHTAGHKQRLIIAVNEELTNPVFEQGVDRAVATLHREVNVPYFCLLVRDAVERGAFHYRIYENGELRHDSEQHKLPALEQAIREKGFALLDPNQQLLRSALSLGQGVESVLISGLTKSEWLGKVVCIAGDAGFSTFALDVVEVMCEAVQQRLVDFNRERRHLAQFFAPRVISELLRDPGYDQRYLSPREEMVAVLYADINSFTKLSEQVLEHPAEIGRFVDRWSAGAVQLLWDHGGVFDKMVGDCIIGLFGPPFFRDDLQARATAALKAARAISEFTIALEKEPPYQGVATSGVIPGLGVAVGLNLCAMSVGLFGPNQDYTGFSPGMNNTARLQSLAGFRETLAMDTLCEAIEKSGDPTLSTLRFGDYTETPVKNVKRPIRYRKITFG